MCVVTGRLTARPLAGRSHHGSLCESAATGWPDYHAVSKKPMSQKGHRQETKSLIASELRRRSRLHHRWGESSAECAMIVRRHCRAGRGGSTGLRCAMGLLTIGPRPLAGRSHCGSLCASAATGRPDYQAVSKKPMSKKGHRQEAKLLIVCELRGRACYIAGPVTPSGRAWR